MDYLLPHIGLHPGSRHNKLRFLALLIRKIFLVNLGVVEQTDRDALKNKRILPSGQNYAKVFKTYFNATIVQDITKRLRYDFKNFPQEAALGDHISFTKGCYVGQEPHARMYHRGHPNWILVQLKLPENMVVSPGSELYAEDQKIGTLTSLSSIQEQGFRNGIGMIRHQIAGSGQDLTIENNKNALIRQQPLPYQI